MLNIKAVDSDNEDYYEPIRISKAFSSNYVEYKTNGDKDKTLSVKKHLNKIRLYLSNMINNLKTQSEWKIQLTRATNSVLTKLIPCIQRVIT